MSRKLEDLRPEFREKVEAWLADCHSVNLDVLITCTLRTGSEQDSLFASGRSTPGPIKTNARAGQSAHNYGLAIDFVVMLQGKPEWSGKDPAWAHAISMAESNGMESLAKSAFPELAHLQMPGWKTYIGVTRI
jgi:peptidoglycan L-alanyl-D-glutamate endopeptidase CwlK